MADFPREVRREKKTPRSKSPHWEISPYRTRDEPLSYVKKGKHNIEARVYEIPAVMRYEGSLNWRWEVKDTSKPHYGSRKVLFPGPEGKAGTREEAMREADIRFKRSEKAGRTVLDSEIGRD